MSKHILVVGANRGIGLAMARALIARGDQVTATSRKASPELESMNLRTEVGVDVTKPESVAALAKSLGGDSVDWLVIVAGILKMGGLSNFDANTIREQFEVNALGPLQTTIALRSCLRRGGKVGLLTSRMGSIEDNTSGGGYGYRMSKAALNMAGRSLAHDLAGDEISVVLLHPGYVRTDMTGNSGHIDTDESAAGLIDRIDELNPASSGTFFHQSGEALPW